MNSTNRKYNRYKKCEFIVQCLIISSLSICQNAFASEKQNEHPDRHDVVRKPNIILIMVDDLGINGIGCYGNKVIRTPNIDRLCREGMKFTQSYSGAPVCAPARCILLTGRHAGQCSVRANSGGVPLPDSDITMAEALKALGYRTGGFGKWALGMQETSGDPLRQGFDEFYGYYHQKHAHNHYPDYLVDNGAHVLIENNIGMDDEYERNGLIPEINPKNGKPLVYAPYRLMDRAKEFIRKNAAHPFFCYLPLTMPHGHFHVPEDDPAGIDLAKKTWSGRSIAIAGMTQILDRQIGELMSLLSEMEISDNTIVIFCSDHGAALRLDGEVDACGHFRGKKRTTYEGGLKVPLIIKWPRKISADTCSDHLTYLGDLFATVIDLACQDEQDRNVISGLLRKQSLTSISLAPTLMQSGIQKKHEFLIWDFAVYNPKFDFWADRMQAIRSENWKLVRQSNKQPWELYDLSQDPTESNDLASRMPEKVDQLAQTFSKNISDIPKQHEAVLDWITPFNWENRNRERRPLTPTVEQVVANSETQFKNIGFEDTAVMLGLTQTVSEFGTIQVNIAWQLEEGRNRNRFIHICDATGKIVRHLGVNRTLMAIRGKKEVLVESIILTREDQKNAAYAAIGFYGQETGMAKSTVQNQNPSQRNKVVIASFREEK